MAGINYVGPRPSADPDVVDKQYVEQRVDTRYLKPVGGIPTSDLDSTTVSKLESIVNKVDTTDPRLSDTRAPKTHLHNGQDVNVVGGPEQQSIARPAILSYNIDEFKNQLDKYSIDCFCVKHRRKELKILTFHLSIKACAHVWEYPWIGLSTDEI